MRRIIRQRATRATPVVGRTAMHLAGGLRSAPVADRLYSHSAIGGYFNVNDYGAQQFLRKAIRTVGQRSLPGFSVISSEQFPAVTPDNDFFFFSKRSLPRMLNNVKSSDNVSDRTNGHV